MEELLGSGWKDSLRNIHQSLYHRNSKKHTVHSVKTCLQAGLGQDHLHQRKRSHPLRVDGAGSAAGAVPDSLHDEAERRTTQTSHSDTSAVRHKELLLQDQHRQYCRLSIKLYR
ncbi:hypothetical protein AOLI_G00089320 [Acnodon oligacanthus]